MRYRGNRTLIPVFKVRPERGTGRTRVLHRNLLMPCDYLPSMTDDDSRPHQPKQPRAKRRSSPPTPPVVLDEEEVRPDESDSEEEKEEILRGYAQFLQNQESTGPPSPGIEDVPAASQGETSLTAARDHREVSEGCPSQQPTVPEGESEMTNMPSTTVEDDVVPTANRISRQRREPVRFGYDMPGQLDTSCMGLQANNEDLATTNRTNEETIRTSTIPAWEAPMLREQPTPGEWRGFRSTEGGPARQYPGGPQPTPEAVDVQESVPTNHPPVPSELEARWSVPMLPPSLGNYPVHGNERWNDPVHGNRPWHDPVHGNGPGINADQGNRPWIPPWTQQPVPWTPAPWTQQPVPWTPAQATGQWRPPPWMGLMGNPPYPGVPLVPYLIPNMTASM